MNLSVSLENAFKRVTTVDELKVVIAGILEEYDYGVLSELESRIEKQEEGK